VQPRVVSARMRCCRRSEASIDRPPAKLQIRPSDEESILLNVSAALVECVPMAQPPANAQRHCRVLALRFKKLPSSLSPTWSGHTAVRPRASHRATLPNLFVAVSGVHPSPVASCPATCGMRAGTRRTCRSAGSSGTGLPTFQSDAWVVRHSHTTARRCAVRRETDCSSPRQEQSYAPTHISSRGRSHS